MMEDKLADMLLNYSLGLTGRDILVLDYQDHADRLTSVVRNLASKSGVRLLEFDRPKIISLAKLRDLEGFVDIATSYLKIGGGEYVLDPRDSKVDVERKEGDIMNKRCNLNWVITQYPSEFLARRVGMSQEELRKLYFACCFVDVREQREFQQTLAGRFNPGSVQMKSSDTDISFEIVGKPHYCDGRINVPDGGIFYEINPFSTNGRIVFKFPTLFGNSYFDGIELKFSRGRVVDFRSNQNEALERLLAIDDGARFLGEFGIGTNHNARVIGHSFYDEKVKGTFHLALGAMYPGFESRLHLDLVKASDGCCIKNNGIDVSII